MSLTSCRTSLMRASMESAAARASCSRHNEGKAASEVRTQGKAVGLPHNTVCSRGFGAHCAPPFCPSRRYSSMPYRGVPRMAVRTGPPNLQLRGKTMFPTFRVNTLVTDPAPHCVSPHKRGVTYLQLRGRTVHTHCTHARALTPMPTHTRAPMHACCPTHLQLRGEHGALLAGSVQPLLQALWSRQGQRGSGG